MGARGVQECGKVSRLAGPVSETTGGQGHCMEAMDLHPSNLVWRRAGREGECGQGGWRR